MAEVKFKKNDVEFKILNEFWAILQRYYIPENTDEYWEAFVRDQEKFIEDYPHPLTRMLSRLLITFLEKKLKGEFENG